MSARREEWIPVWPADALLAWHFRELIESDAILRVGNVALELRVHKSVEVLVQVKVAPSAFLSTEIYLWLSSEDRLLIFCLQIFMADLIEPAKPPHGAFGISVSICGLSGWESSVWYILIYGQALDRSG